MRMGWNTFANLRASRLYQNRSLTIPAEHRQNNLTASRKNLRVVQISLGEKGGSML
jgi:hypothetical protein